EAARQYHADRGNRCAIVEIEADRLELLRQLLNDSVSIDAARRAISTARYPQATADALLCELRANGIKQLSQPTCQRRLADIYAPQSRQLAAALIRLKPQYPAITDDLILAIDGLAS